MADQSIPALRHTGDIYALLQRADTNIPVEVVETLLIQDLSRLAAKLDKMDGVDGKVYQSTLAKALEKAIVDVSAISPEGAALGKQMQMLRVVVDKMPQTMEIRRQDIEESVRIFTAQADANRDGKLNRAEYQSDNGTMALGMGAVNLIVRVGQLDADMEFPTPGKTPAPGNRSVTEPQR